MGVWLMLLGLLGLCGCCGVRLEVGPCAVCLILHQIPGSIEVVVELDVVHGGGQACVIEKYGVRREFRCVFLNS